jgi:hypothetical protein
MGWFGPNISKKERDASSIGKYMLEGASSNKKRDNEEEEGEEEEIGVSHKKQKVLSQLDTTTKKKTYGNFDNF